MAYGSENPSKIVGQYRLINLQSHRVMDDFLWTQFRKHPEVYLHITLYIFEHRAPQVEVLALKHEMEAKAKTLNQMEKICKEIWSRVYLLTGK